MVSTPVDVSVVWSAIAGAPVGDMDGHIYAMAKKVQLFYDAPTSLVDMGSQVTVIRCDPLVAADEGYAEVEFTADDSSEDEEVEAQDKMDTDDRAGSVAGPAHLPGTYMYGFWVEGTGGVRGFVFV